MIEVARTMGIEIKNLRNEKPQNPWDVKVCRRSSPLGNPFEMENKTEKERNRVCELYIVWFEENLSNPLIFNELERFVQLYKRYGKLNLFCWCAPLRCHAETILAYILKRLQEDV